MDQGLELSNPSHIVPWLRVSLHWWTDPSSRSRVLRELGHPGAEKLPRRRKSYRHDQLIRCTLILPLVLVARMVCHNLAPVSSREN